MRGLRCIVNKLNEVESKNPGLSSGVFDWYTITGSNRGHPARLRRFYLVSFGVIRSYVGTPKPSDCNGFQHPRQEIRRSVN
mgnify:CR=1 FL=1